MRMGKKLVVERLLKIADVYIDSCEDEFHMETYSTGVFLTTLAKGYLK